LPFWLTKYRNDARENTRLSNRLARSLIALLASLLILGVVAAELPELLSLVDDTTNDFVVRKAGHGDTHTLNTQSHSVVGSGITPLRREGCGARAAGAIMAVAGPTELFLLHSVLRR
jgi:hypothetical protein